MGTWRAFFAIGLIAACGLAASADDDVAVADGRDESVAAPLRESRARSSSQVNAENISDWPPVPPDAVPSDQPIQAPQPRQPDEYLAPPGSQLSSTEIMPALPIIPRLVESTWYARFEYLNWSAHGNSIDQGPLYTLGYQRRVGWQRFRAELFGSRVYLPPFKLADGERLARPVDYLGGRVEYDLLFEPVWAERVLFFGGIGSRFWLRDVVQQMPVFRQIGNVGTTIEEPNVQQSFLTFYPYVGMETRRNADRTIEPYGRARIGLLALTYEHITVLERTFFREPGVTGQTELGVRGDRFFLSGYFEAFAWPRSNNGSAGNLTTMMLLTVGLKTGFNY